MLRIFHCISKFYVVLLKTAKLGRNNIVRQGEAFEGVSAKDENALETGDGAIKGQASR